MIHTRWIKKRIIRQWQGVRWLAALLFVLWIFLLYLTSLRLPDVRSIIADRAIISHQELRFRQELTQRTLDYFANTIQVKYTVLANNYKGKKTFLAQVTLINAGSRVFPGSGWSIVFCQPYVLEPTHAPFPNGLVNEEHGVRFYSHMGGVYSVEPIESFGDIDPGGNKSFRFISQYANIAITDSYPNWYFAVPGLEARIIENTRGEGYDWVGKFDSPSLWKRVLVKDDAEYDTYDPFTPEDRYYKNKVADMSRAPIPVIPSPVSVSNYEPTRTMNVFSGSWVIVARQKLPTEATYLSNIWNLPVVDEAPSRNYIQFIEEPINVHSDGKPLPTNEAYELSVSPESSTITIKASQPTGAFYAIQSLLSLTGPNGDVSQVQITDAPRFEYRGLMLDVARNFRSKEQIFRYINLMAMYKLNKLHLHLTDDEGWRLAIPGLPELTEIGATRCHDLTETKCLLPFLGSGPFTGPPGTGHYTVEDYRDILRYAAAHHIEVIPEVDMPGHSHAAIRAMEARHRRLVNVNVSEASRYLLQDLQDRSQYKSIQNFLNNAINPCLQSTYTFISRVLNALYAMHRDVNPLKVFHFGGDEVAKGAWKNSPVCKRLVQSGVDMALADYLAIQVANMTSLYGLDLAGWEDGMMDDTTPMKRNLLKNSAGRRKSPLQYNRNVYAYTWNNVWEWGFARRAYDFANNDYKLVITSGTNLYFDHPYEPDPLERGLYWATRYTDTKQVFSFTPENIYWSALSTRQGKEVTICQREPEKCPPLKKPQNLVGIQGTLFGELLRTQTITDTMLLPRLIGLAERAWHKAPWESEIDKVKRDTEIAANWEEFANTLGHKELRRLDKMGYEYRIPLPGAIIQDGVLTAATTYPGLQVEMSQDQGGTWVIVPDSGLIVKDQGEILLRTRSSMGNRYSRQVTIPMSNSNTGLITTVSLLTLLGCFILRFLAVPS